MKEKQKNKIPFWKIIIIIVLIGKGVEILVKKNKTSHSSSSPEIKRIIKE
jgi:hypothetical protein